MPPPYHGSLHSLSSLPSRATALLALPDGQVLAGTSDGSLLLYDAQHKTLRARSAIKSSRGLPVTQLITDPSAAYVFVLQGGAVLLLRCPLAPDDHSSEECPALQLVPLPPLEDEEDESCIAATWTRRLGTRLCCASRDGCLHIFGLSLANNDLFELQCRVPVSLPVGFSRVRSLAWSADDDSLLLSDGRRLAHVPSLPPPFCYPGSNGGGGSRDAPTVSAALFGVQPLPPSGSEEGGGPGG